MIAIASDHGGYDLKMALIAHMERRLLPFVDLGCHDKNSCDYPDFAEMAAAAIRKCDCEKAIVICTTGIGISIAANRIPGIRCALCTDTHMAKMSRAHNDANILALGGAIISPEQAIAIVDTFLETNFSREEKHRRRIGKLG